MHLKEELMGIDLQLQGWYNKLQRDEVVAEWKKRKGKMSLHVHCHISGGHFLLDLFSRLRYFIFCKELPVVSFKSDHFSLLPIVIVKSQSIEIKD